MSFPSTSIVKPPKPFHSSPRRGRRARGWREPPCREENEFGHNIG